MGLKVGKKGLYRDYFLHADIMMMAVVLIGLATWAAFAALNWHSLVFFIVGLIGFMFSEYLTHRFFFHLKAPQNPLFLKFLKRLHYDHHADPHDLKLLFLPVWYSLPNLGVFALLFYLIAGSMDFTLAFAAGLVAMLLVYEWKHYVAHRPIQPKTRFWKWNKRMHLLHHFKNENYWYGVSTPLVDALFGTLKEEKDVPTSATAKNLENRGRTMSS
ncbi:fatty acid hydroxylase [Paenibacillus glycanilyticus]|uniref:Fatty acid hydroxylase n=1 Tax=Paenibacillus glycanilyticus TaxID=126569 RepID=A0ABQ6NHC4_9BACL|nr:sterol desaturase family protein [Paenibacillus glycanilyticus]GMK43592.1 fatty acid hydroxylase [Paenibacillus glycanilyticus]